MQSKKVLIISRVKSTKYGDSTRPYYLGEGLSSSGYNVTNFCFLDKNETNVKYIKLFDKGTDKLKNIWRLYTLLKQLINHKYDYIYGHQLLGGLLGVLIKKRILKDSLLIIDAHTSDSLESSNEPGASALKSFLLKKIEKYVLKNVDSIITVSKETKNEFLKIKINPEKIQIIKNGSTPNEIYPNEKDNQLLKKYDLHQNKIGLFINPRDGFFSNQLADDLINKWAKELYNTDPTIKILIIGGGDIPKNISPNIIYTGFVEEYTKHLNLADFFLGIYPPNAVCGGTRNKICDYIMVSKPIIATKEGMRGFDDLNEKTHYIEVNTSSEFTNQIVNLMSNKSLQKEINTNLSAKISDYSWENAVKQLITLFDSYGTK